VNATFGFLPEAETNIRKSGSSATGAEHSDEITQFFIALSLPVQGISGTFGAIDDAAVCSGAALCEP